ncbi:hypothetical protein H5410_019883 [Solanum commersonii]|uniref:Uncharacterized protein n=1 Tax=Solanum commersonii TaxID=4109 RepID=A0A9J5Z7K2_SOLCO|nr:hypothetical protein H5410_019883 [Solanum commersonii]
MVMFQRARFLILLFRYALSFKLMLPLFLLSKWPRGWVSIKGTFVERNGEQKSFNQVKWEPVSLDRNSGGLGVKHLKIHRTSLLHKWLWRFDQEVETLWKIVIARCIFTITQDTAGAEESYGPHNTHMAEHQVVSQKQETVIFRPECATTYATSDSSLVGTLSSSSESEEDSDKLPLSLASFDFSLLFSFCGTLVVDSTAFDPFTSDDITPDEAGTGEETASGAPKSINFFLQDPVQKILELMKVLEMSHHDHQY